MRDKARKGNVMDLETIRGMLSQIECLPRIDRDTWMPGIGQCLQVAFHRPRLGNLLLLTALPGSVCAVITTLVSLIAALSSMVVIRHMWLFKFKLMKMR